MNETDEWIDEKYIEKYIFLTYDLSLNIAEKAKKKK